VTFFRRPRHHLRMHRLIDDFLSILVSPKASLDHSDYQIEWLWDSHKLPHYKL